MGQSHDSSPGGPRDDVRVVDVLNAEAPHEVDPALVATLHAWFEGPAMGLDQLLEPPPDEDRRISFDDVDPLLYDKLDGRRSGGEMLRWADRVPTLPLERRTARFEPALSLPSTETKDIDLPWQLRDALSECTPQALLRDLARVEPPVPDGPFHFVQQGLSIDLDGAHQQALAAMSARYSVRTELATELMNQGLAELQEILDAPWEDSAPEEPAQYISLAEAYRIMAELDEMGL